MFIQGLFPNLINEIQALSDWYSKMLNIKKKTTIKTVDGSSIHYTLLQKKRISRTTFNPKTLEAKTYKIYIEQDTLDKQKLQQSFLPNLTHSIDSGFLRIFLSQLYKITGYRANHLHDSLQVHPNYLNELYTVIEDTYKFLTPKELLNETFYKPNLSEIPQNRSKEITDLFIPEKEPLNLDSLDVKDMYPLEG